jgi:hypothetical protein
MPDSLLSNHTAYVASLRGCPSCPDRLSAIAGMRTSEGAQVGGLINAPHAAPIQAKNPERPNRGVGARI